MLTCRREDPERVSTWLLPAADTVGFFWEARRHDRRHHRSRQRHIGGCAGHSGRGRPREASRIETIHSRLPADLVERLVGKVSIHGAVGGRTQSYSPLTGELIADYPASAPQDVRAAFEKARAAQQAWAKRRLAHRTKVARRLHDLLLERSDSCWTWCRSRPARPASTRGRGALALPAATRHYAHASRGYIRTKRRRGVLPVLTKVSEIRIPRASSGSSRRGTTRWRSPCRTSCRRLSRATRWCTSRTRDRADRAAAAGARGTGRAAGGPVAGRRRRRAGDRARRGGQRRLRGVHRLDRTGRRSRSRRPGG